MPGTEPATPEGQATDMPHDLPLGPASAPLPGALPGEPAWRELCTALNGLRRESGSWWGAMADDRETVPRVDESTVTVRLSGNVLAEVGLRHGAPQCRMEPAHLLLAHPGAKIPVGETGAAVRSVRTLGELAGHYGHVRRLVRRHVARRQAVLARLFLRHSCGLAIAGRPRRLGLGPRSPGTRGRPRHTPFPALPSAGIPARPSTCPPAYRRFRPRPAPGRPRIPARRPRTRT